MVRNMHKYKQVMQLPDGFLTTWSFYGPGTPSLFLLRDIILKTHNNMLWVGFNLFLQYL